MHSIRLNNITEEDIITKLLYLLPNFKEYYFNKWYDNEDLLNKYETLWILSDYFKENLLDKNYLPIIWWNLEINLTINFLDSFYNKSNEINNLIMVWFFENFLVENIDMMKNFSKLLDWKILLKEELNKLYFWWYKTNIY